jgi:hypothetical protein
VYCTGMVARTSIGAMIGIVLAASAAGAQDNRPAPGPLPIEMRREAKPRPIVRPGVDSDQAARDAADYERQQRDEALMREQTRPSVRRPDLGYDVTGSIQQRNIMRR